MNYINHVVLLGRLTCDATVIASVMYSNNEVGTLQPIRELGVDALISTDGDAVQVCVIRVHCLSSSWIGISSAGSVSIITLFTPELRAIAIAVVADQDLKKANSLVKKKARKGKGGSATAEEPNADEA